MPVGLYPRFYPWQFKTVKCKDGSSVSSRVRLRSGLEVITASRKIENIGDENYWRNRKWAGVIDSPNSKDHKLPVAFRLLDVIGCYVPDANGELVELPIPVRDPFGGNELPLTADFTSATEQVISTTSEEVGSTPLVTVKRKKPGKSVGNRRKK